MNLKSYRKRTEYNAEKENKRKNFIFLNENYCLKGQTVIAGDSITEIFNMELFNYYVKNSGNLVYNRGISGDTSDRFLERFDETVMSLEPSKLVLLIGTNDLSLVSDTDYVCNNIENVVMKAAASSSVKKIIVQSVYPVAYKNRKKNKNIISLNSKIRAVCDKYGAVYLDIHSLLLNDKGGFCEKYTYDGLHPNAAGFEIVSKQIIPLLMD